MRQKCYLTLATGRVWLISYQLRLSHMSSDVGQIFPAASLHRDHSISYAMVCEKNRIHHWCPVGTEKSQPEGPPFRWETRLAKFKKCGLTHILILESVLKLKKCHFSSLQNILISQVENPLPPM